VYVKYNNNYVINNVCYFFYKHYLPNAHYDRNNNNNNSSGKHRYNNSYCIIKSRFLNVDNQYNFFQDKKFLNDNF